MINFGYLYQPLSQFEATLYSNSYFNSNLLSFETLFFIIDYFISFDFLFDVFFFVSGIWFFDINNQYNWIIFDEVKNCYSSEIVGIIYFYLNCIFIANELSEYFFIFYRDLCKSVFLVPVYNEYYEGGLINDQQLFLIFDEIALQGIILSPVNTLFVPDMLFNSSYAVTNVFVINLIQDVVEVFYQLFNYLIFIFVYRFFIIGGLFMPRFYIKYENVISDLNYDSFSFIDTSITKFHISSLFILIYFLLFLVLCFKNSRYYFRNWNIILFGFFDEFLSNTIVQQLGIKRGQRYSVFLKSLFYLILFGNVFGLIPFSFTITSHLIYTFSLSLSILVGITILALYLQGVKFFKLFVPRGAPIPLLLLLVPIEIISYVARCFSLAIRLFANMMSGHTLLNILSGFVIKMSNNGLLLIALAPFVVVMAVSVLEMGIAFLQAYVFVVLVCIYLKDGFEAGH